MKLRFTARAIADLIEIADYIHAHNPAASRRVRAAIYDSLQNLILFPDVGREQTVEGVRKFVTRKYAYLVYYTVDQAAEEIVILTVQGLMALAYCAEGQLNWRNTLALFPPYKLRHTTSRQ